MIDEGSVSGSVREGVWDVLLRSGRWPLVTNGHRPNVRTITPDSREMGQLFFVEAERCQFPNIPLARSMRELSEVLSTVHSGSGQACRAEANWASRFRRSVERH